jgi:hypothetical protein
LRIAAGAVPDPLGPSLRGWLRDPGAGASQLSSISIREKAVRERITQLLLVLTSQAQPARSIHVRKHEMADLVSDDPPLPFRRYPNIDQDHLAIPPIVDPAVSSYELSAHDLDANSSQRPPFAQEPSQVTGDAGQDRKEVGESVCFRQACPPLRPYGVRSRSGLGGALHTRMVSTRTRMDPLLYAQATTTTPLPQRNCSPRHAKLLVTAAYEPPQPRHGTNRLVPGDSGLLRPYALT